MSGFGFVEYLLLTLSVSYIRPTLKVLSLTALGTFTAALRFPTTLTVPVN